MKPYTLVNHRNGTFSVKRNGELLSTHATKKQAEAEIRILYLWQFGEKIAMSLE